MSILATIGFRLNERKKIESADGIGAAELDISFKLVNTQDGFSGTPDLSDRRIALEGVMDWEGCQE